MEPGLPTDDLGEVGVQASLPSSARDQRSTPFQFTLQLNGSERLSLVPIGRTTDVSLRADWPSPSFQGAFLPAERDITAQGFTSHWHVLHLNRPFPQQFTGARHDLFPSAFGVELKVPVDEYQKNTRAAKYGSLLITMVFAVFFFVEVLQRVRIHPLQYLLVGLALCIFYTLLLAISEQWGFGPAYLAAAVAVVALVVLYARHVFRSARATALLAGILVLVYGFIFTIINMEELSLLIGSIGLFITLAVVMYLSRKIDWYGEGS
jgi:inner membrane protein